MLRKTAKLLACTARSTWRTRLRVEGWGTALIRCNMNQDRRTQETKYCAGMHKYQYRLDEVYLRYMIPWPYSDDGTIILVTIEVPAVP